MIVPLLTIPARRGVPQGVTDLDIHKIAKKHKGQGPLVAHPYHEDSRARQRIP